MSEPQLASAGPGAPPRVNGEILFDAPWQSRSFGLAAALAEAGRITWPAFQAALIHRVGAADAAELDTGTPDGYWRCWLDALGDVASASDALDARSWAERTQAFTERAPGHDHDHGHDHGHSHDHGHHDHSH